MYVVVSMDNMHSCMQWNFLEAFSNVSRPPQKTALNLIVQGFFISSLYNILDGIYDGIHSNTYSLLKRKDN